MNTPPSTLIPGLPPTMSAENLRAALVQALRRRGFGEVCSDEPAAEGGDSDGLGGVVVVALLLGVITYLTVALGTNIWQTIGLGVVVLGILTGIGSIAPRFSAVLLVVAWVATGVTELRHSGLEDLVLTHGVPLVVVASIYWLLRSRRLAAAARSAPLMFPVVLIAIFIPLLSADLWQAAHDLDAYLIAIVAGLVIIPMLLGLRKKLRDSIEAVFVVQAGEIESQDAPEEQTLQTIEKVSGKVAAWQVQHGELLEKIRRSLDPPFPSQYGAIAGALVGPSFKRQVTLRLVPLAVALIVILAFYIYLLAWAVIPISTASQWIDADIHTTAISFLGLTVTAPVGVYLGVSALLGAVATAVFFAFVLTEDAYSTALASALVHEPVQDCLTLAVPYFWLREHETDAATERRSS